MRVRWLLLALACALGAAVAALAEIATGDSPPGTASFRAYDYGWQADGGSGSSATIAAGGTVTISYPNGSSAHNADFGSGPQPTGCTQTAGAVSGAVPPLPHRPSSPGWSGSCTFNAAGTYTFHCDLHPFMTATITVKAAPPPTTSTTTTGTTTTGTTTTGTTTTATTTTDTTTTTATTTTTSPPPISTTVTPPPPPTGSTVTVTPPPAAAAASAIRVALRQRGAAIRGTLTVSEDGAGGRLDVYAFASPRSLGRSAGSWRRVGRLARTGLAPGTVRFSLALDAAAIRARPRNRLTVVVGVIVRSPHATTAWTIRRVQVLSSA